MRLVSHGCGLFRAFHPGPCPVRRSHLCSTAMCTSTVPILTGHGRFAVVLAIRVCVAAGLLTLHRAGGTDAALAYQELW